MLPVSLENIQELSLPSEDYQISRIAICYYYTLKLSGHLAHQEQSLFVVGLAWITREGAQLLKGSCMSVGARCLSATAQS